MAKIDKKENHEGRSWNDNYVYDKGPSVSYNISPK